MVSPSKQRVLITGIDSFTGYHLKQQLEISGFCVSGTCLSSTFAKEADNENTFVCDITNKQALIDVLKQCRPDYLIHLAGISFVGHPVIEDFYRINVVGTQNILDALLESQTQIKKVILASSATVYGNQGIEVLDESICPQPANHYGMSKLSMEHMARTYFDKLPIIVTRPFNYTGARQADNFVIPKIVKHFKQKSRSIELGNLHVEREFNDVAYACEVYKHLLQVKQSGEIVNLCSGRGVNLLSVVDLMNEIAGYDIEVGVNPDFVRPNELPRLIGSVNKLQSLIGELPVIPLKNTLTGMYNHG